MPLEIKFVGTAQVVRRVRALGEQVAPAIARAINRVIPAIARDAESAIEADANVDPKYVSRGITQSKATATRLVGIVAVSGKGIPLSGFEPSQGPTGVTTRLRGRGGFVAHGFLTATRSGHRGVFLRAGKARLPIREVFGPSLATIVKQRAILDQLRADGEAGLASAVEDEIRGPLRDLA